MNVIEDESTNKVLTANPGTVVKCDNPETAVRNNTVNVMIDYGNKMTGKLDEIKKCDNA